MSAIFSITNTESFDQFATNFAKHTKLKATHVRAAIAKTRGFQTVASYKAALDNTPTVTLPLATILKQIERANNLIALSGAYQDNDIDELISLLPFFSEEYADDLSLSPNNADDADYLLLNTTCKGAATNYLNSQGNSITVSCDYLRNDNAGNNHYRNVITATDGHHEVVITTVTVLSRDRDEWNLERHEPIKVTIDNKAIEGLFFDNIDDFVQLICPEYNLEFLWQNPVDPTLLAKANTIIVRNQTALQNLQGINDFD